MTKEQKKKLAEEWSIKISSVIEQCEGTVNAIWYREELEQLIDIVAAEARRGGIEEMRDAARRVAGSNLMLFADINAEAKRLKEQGK